MAFLGGVSVQCTKTQARIAYAIDRHMIPYAKTTNVYLWLLTATFGVLHWRHMIGRLSMSACVSTSR